MLSKKKKRARAKRGGLYLVSPGVDQLGISWTCDNEWDDFQVTHVDAGTMFVCCGAIEPPAHHKKRSVVLLGTGEVGWLWDHEIGYTLT